MKLPYYLAAILALCLLFISAYTFRIREVAIERSAEIGRLEAQIHAAPPVSDAWQLVTNNAPFSARDGAFVASFQGYLWLVNGWTGEEFDNPVYRSKDGKDWEVAVEKAPFERRHLGGFVVLADKLWMIGGDFLTDVWSSVDGLNWEQVTAQAPWGERYNPYIGAFDGKLWLMGGLSREFEPFRDVWSSSDGKNWEQVQPRAPWRGRGLISGFAVHDGAMWLMGGGVKVVNPAETIIKGETLVDLSDVWRSTDGVNWELVNARAAWAPRTHLSVGSFDGHLVVVDGSISTQGGLSNEAWKSTDGVLWDPIGGAAEQAFPPRHASSLVEHEGSLFLIAGFLHNDVWRLDYLR